ncbi:PREDICTED: uncharacterized protein LOC106332855 [Brassica oleracea var. oleracea]|uniref:uncharacterized protein LOC106332855 n=1 Tax=Brassica oleracea var. oleracea TaxID=109376 RepID=UPI0006A70DA3|nr:PREDICTED: uncharacterized protein LOC106332855 [Brassica oleracea var. oleracea]
MKDGAEIKWISGDGEGEDEIYTIVLRKSMEEITYYGLVEQEDDKTDGNVGLSDREAIEAGDEDGSENDETDVYVGISDKEATEAGDEDGNGGVLTFHEDIEMHDGVNQIRDDGMDLVIGAKDGCEWSVRVAMLKNSDIWTNDATGDEGTGGVLTFHGDIEMHENFTERDEHVFGDTEVRPQVVYQPRDDGTSLVVGQEFRTKEEEKVHIQTASHQKCFEFDITKSDTPRFVVKCRGAKDGCKWFVRVVKLKNIDLWTVRSYIKQHTCSVVTTRTLHDRRKGTSQIVASVLAQDYPGTFDTPVPKVLIDLVHRRVGVRTNIGTRTRVVVDEANKFKYLFFALGASIEGFNAMRKVLIVDGTHLKNVYGGVLLVATAQDPDHHHYPIAFGVADGANDESWIWFMQQLKLVIFDVPGLFRECAHAYTEVEFKYLYDAFRRKYPSAAAYLDKSVEEKKWARCYFRGDRYNVDTTNSVESFNGVIKEARKYTLLPMFDVIIAKISEWFNNNRKEAAEIPYTLKLVPILETEMSKRCVNAGFLTIDELNSFYLEYSVHGTDGKVYTVDIAKNTCSCEQFNKDKYPCVHGVAAATFMSKAAGRELHLSEYCSKYYLVEQWALAYHRTIYLVPHMSDSENPVEEEKEAEEELEEPEEEAEPEEKV